MDIAEKKRLEEDSQHLQYWRRWGSYLSERQWGTVREDRSSNGDAWRGFTFEDAKHRAYDWGEDGIAGLCDNHQRLCFSWTMWNERDSCLKERLFGLGGDEGNHGEDIKEYFFYLDNTPTHSYMKYLYKYPQEAFPYELLRSENRRRTTRDLEFELLDTGIFQDRKYFDIVFEYAKADPDDIVISATISNRGKQKAILHLLPTLWFRNTWTRSPTSSKPSLQLQGTSLIASHPSLGVFYLHYPQALQLLFTENEDGRKNAFHPAIINQDHKQLNSIQAGTKSALHYRFEIEAGESQTLYLRLTSHSNASTKDIPTIIATRKKEADEFYTSIMPTNLSADERLIQRQAFAGLLWNMKFYKYVVAEWLKINPSNPRNHRWEHLYSEDILSTPDAWEYPAFFSWDTAFHTLPLALIDPANAKKQLDLLTREWYMHPDGQIPAYEWSFSDVNPPLHAWAALRVFKITEKMHGNRDTIFLERIFQKMLLNFTWWVNRKDSDSNNIFQGGFLGLDNIGVFDRSAPPCGDKLYQSDATSWMGMYALNMLTIALELAQTNRVYEDMASKFFEHFLYIAQAMDFGCHNQFSLWDEKDGFYYDLLVTAGGEQKQLKIRSIVGLMPMFAVATNSVDHLNQFTGYRKRKEWFIKNRHDLCNGIASLEKTGINGRTLLAIVSEAKLKRILQYMLDEKEFLSPYGIRSLSKFHEKNPYHLQIGGKDYWIAYENAESFFRMYGGNSNWRGPVWFPLNMLIIESLQKYHYYFGDTFKVECPTGSGRWMNLWDVSLELSQRLVNIFRKGSDQRRPVFGGQEIFNSDPHWQDMILFYEYYHGCIGAGIGASHQTGWSALVAKLLQQLATYASPKQ